MRFEIGQRFVGTISPVMHAQVIEVRNEGRDATLRLIGRNSGTKFELNAGAVMAGHQHWRLIDRE